MKFTLNLFLLVFLLSCSKPSENNKAKDIDPQKIKRDKIHLSKKNLKNNEFKKFRLQIKSLLQTYQSFDDIKKDLEAKKGLHYKDIAILDKNFMESYGELAYQILLRQEAYSKTI